MSRPPATFRSYVAIRPRLLRAFARPRARHALARVGLLGGLRVTFDMPAVMGGDLTIPCSDVVVLGRGAGR